MKRLVGTLGVLAFFAIGAIGALRVWTMAGATYDAVTFPSHVAAGLSPHLKSSDAYRITVDYLNAQTPQRPSDAHVNPALKSIWAVTADQAAALDGCIPTGKGSAIVWVTKGVGDYLNLADHLWSQKSAGMADGPFSNCRGSASAGTLVIDDATGTILGVFPDQGASLPHPSPQITLSPATPTPLVPSTSPRPSGSAGAGGSAKPGPTAKPSPKPSTSPKPSPSASPKPSPSPSG